MKIRKIVRAKVQIRKRVDFISLENVKEHAPLSARASVDHGVEVETTGEHENRAADRAADRGCRVSACSTSSVDICEDGGTRQILIEQKSGCIYLGINVDADLCLKLSPDKRQKLLNLLLSADDGELNI